MSVVSEYIAPAPARHLPHMLLATTLVAVLPLVVSLALRATGVISGWISVGLAVVMSLAASSAGSTYWRKRGGHGEVLFSELLLWGWLRRWRQERELANATRLLDLVNPGTRAPGDRDQLSVERRELLLRQLAGALEGQDVYLNGHSRRVARHATMIARGLGLSSEDVARIRAAAAVHDVGKLRTPKAILNKPGRLTDEEFEVIKRHPGDGAEIVAALGDPELTRIVRHHHERLDGAGYPDRLRGEEIPLGARIIAVADTFDAITSARPYREAAPHQKAIDILRTEAGTQLDPDAVRAFLAYYSGKRPALVWAIITSSVRRVAAWLSGDPAAAATISASKVAVATVATATIGAVAAAAPVPIVHHAARSAAVHNTAVRPRGARTTLHRPGASVTRPAGVSAAAKSKTKTTAARPRRGPAHRAAARRHAHVATAKKAHSPAGAGGTGSAGSSGVSSQAATRSQSAATRSVAVAGSHTPANHPSSAGHSQGSSASGNAYGHTKPLGNGHGQGVANGHANPTSSAGGHTSPTANGVAHASPNANVPPTVPTGSGSQGTASSPAGGSGNAQGGGSAQGNPSGQSNGQGSGQSPDNPHVNQSQPAGSSAAPTPAPAPTPTPAGNQGDTNGHGASANGG